MGTSDLHLLLASPDLKGIVLESISSGGPLSCKVSKAQAIRRRSSSSRRSNGGGHRLRARLPRISMKRRRILPEGSTRAMNEMEKKVRTLKKLIPNGKSSMGLDGLFRETAEYIESLQMRVKVMQVMVKALSGSDE
ncbi:transcription factor UPBEAT1-like [Macadamia integrifolia]|uniref:transcription factor UPBEAT1-like n=1 Tax=Macadamia integrifolia TaxID=60698 RepID=UPI001C4FEFD0|nr:transcription factor UPBEAT1-like [Macadamia integrifolia]